MAVTVRIPAALRADAGGMARLEVEGDAAAPLAGLLDRMAARWPLLDRRIRDEHGRLRRYVNIYVDGEECRRVAGLATPVPDRAEVVIAPSVAGG
jgi:molybdopterin converting factor small subunit